MAVEPIFILTLKESSHCYHCAGDPTEHSQRALIDQNVYLYACVCMMRFEFLGCVLGRKAILFSAADVALLVGWNHNIITRSNDHKEGKRTL